MKQRKNNSIINTSGLYYKVFSDVIIEKVASLTLSLKILDYGGSAQDYYTNEFNATLI